MIKKGKGMRKETYVQWFKSDISFFHSLIRNEGSRIIIIYGYNKL